jgi:hypothetical protein
MPATTRRRGAQPGNQNALKHGFYCHKPAPGGQARGGQPFNLNALVHGGYSALLSAAFTALTKPAYPPAAGSLLPQPAGSGIRPTAALETQLTPEPQLASEPQLVLEQHSAKLVETLSVLERQTLDLIDDPQRSSAELQLGLRQLRDQVGQLLQELSDTPLPKPNKPERKPK